MPGKPNPGAKPPRKPKLPKPPSSKPPRKPKPPRN